MPDTPPKGIVFNIQPYSIHDGPGIRTTVFLMGCPLRCKWCQNPESQFNRPTLFYNAEKCAGCGRCLPACRLDAIQIIDGISVTDRGRCDDCGECAPRCPHVARTIVGEALSAEAVFEEISKDALFYQSSQGGVTISGGDPVEQPGFTIRLSRLCHENDIHVALETCGYAPWETMKAILASSDLVLFDFKHMDDDVHKACTGVSNRSILENARRIYHELKKPMIARVPVVPGYNTSAENMQATAAFIAAELGRNVPVHLLPYHRLATGKYTRLERRPPVDDIAPPTDAQMQALLEVVMNMGLEGKIGG